MVKITQKGIAKYKRMEKRSWHDQEWHDYMGTEKSEAIGYALGAGKETGDTIRDTQEKANKYLGLAGSMIRAL